MTQEQEKAFFEKLKNEQVDILFKKSADYADQDVLSNFKRIARLCDIMSIDVSKPEGITFFFVLHKLDRLANLQRKGTDPQNESLKDTFNDAHNYLFLYQCLLEEYDKNKISISRKKQTQKGLSPQNSPIKKRSQENKKYIRRKKR